ncbi:MAG: hypothetical protein HYW48_01275 [Deltaproteobacteria bacterium]|nr:hypothetical protein [Deltaproteobacteria bacterium]
MAIAREWNIAILLTFLMSCGGGDSGGGEAETSAAVETELTTTTSVIITGQLALENRDESATQTLFENQLVELEDGKGQVVGQGYSDKSGKYAVNAGSLVLPVVRSSLALSGTSYTIVSLLDLDDEGKIFGVKKEIELDTSKVVDGKYEAGSTLFAEVAAIKGRVKFINPDGTENTKIAKIGTDEPISLNRFFRSKA